MTVWPRKRSSPAKCLRATFCLRRTASPFFADLRVRRESSLPLPVFFESLSFHFVGFHHIRHGVSFFPPLSEMMESVLRCTLCLTARAIFAVCPANVIQSFCVQAPLMIHSASIVSHIAHYGSSYLLLSCCTTAQPRAASRVETPINEQSIAMCSRNPSTLLWHSLAMCPRAMSAPATCCLSILRRTWDTTQV